MRRSAPHKSKYASDGENDCGIEEDHESEEKEEDFTLRDTAHDLDALKKAVAYSVLKQETLVGGVSRNGQALSDIHRKLSKQERLLEKLLMQQQRASVVGPRKSKFQKSYSKMGPASPVPLTPASMTRSFTEEENVGHSDNHSRTPLPSSSFSSMPSTLLKRKEKFHDECQRGCKRRRLGSSLDLEYGWLSLVEAGSLQELRRRIDVDPSGPFHLAFGEREQLLLEQSASHTYAVPELATDSIASLNPHQSEPEAKQRIECLRKGLEGLTSVYNAMRDVVDDPTPSALARALTLCAFYCTNLEKEREKEMRRLVDVMDGECSLQSSRKVDVLQRREREKEREKRSRKKSDVQLESLTQR